MSHLHWMKFYIGDELAATSHMTPAEFGSYVYLKMHYWKFGSLPTEDERLARIAHVSPEQWSAIKPSIEILFEDGWRSQRMDEIRAEAEEKHRKRVEAGKQGGRPKKAEKAMLKQSFSNEKAMPKQPEPEPEPEPYLDSHPESGPDVSALEDRRDTYPREEYPRRSRAFPIPPNAEIGKRLLLGRGVPPVHASRLLPTLMNGELYPFDIEEWSKEEQA